MTSTSLLVQQSIRFCLSIFFFHTDKDIDAMVPKKATGKVSKSKSVSKKRKRTSSERGRVGEKHVKVIDDDLKKLLTGAVDNDNTTTNKDGDKRNGIENKENPPLNPISSDEKASNDDDDENDNDKAEAMKVEPDFKNIDEQQQPTWCHPPLSESRANKVNVIVILERANLELVNVNGRSGVTLLNSDDHNRILSKSNRDANDARPDITHQCLLALQDSPLNKTGRLKVYVRTAKNVLIDIHPQTRIPRTYKRFAGLMAELLEKLKVRGTTGATPLLKTIRNPITAHLPVGARKIVCTYNTENVIDVREHARQMVHDNNDNNNNNSIQKNKDDGGRKITNEEDDEDINVVYVVGAMAHGKITEDWADDYICISEYPLSAATVCSRILYAYETMLNIM